MNFENLYINGEYVDSTSDKFIEVENPATNEIIGRVPRGNAEDVEKAALAAKEAFKTFIQTSLDDRIEIMKKFADYLKENLDEIAELITKELGSPIEFSKKTHVKSQIDRVEKYIEMLKQGCSKKSINLLKMVDVDLESKDTYKSAIEFYSKKIKELKNLL